MIEILISLALLLILDIAAVRWGADSRFSTGGGKNGIR
jgi:hypothetical protein